MRSWESDSINMSVIQPTSLRLVKALDTGLQIYTLNWKQLPQHMQMTVNVSSSVSLSFVKQFEHLKKTYTAPPWNESVQHPESNWSLLHPHLPSLDYCQPPHDVAYKNIQLCDQLVSLTCWTIHEYSLIRGDLLAQTPKMSETLSTHAM